MKICRPTSDSDRAGSVTVEFALTLPLALMLTFAMCEFGRANMLRNTAENAAYEGARAGIIPGSTVAKSKKEAKEVLDILGVTGATIVVSPSIITNSTPEVTVTVTVPLARNLWLSGSFFTKQQIKKTCTLTREGVH